jgi:hypothetical protein
MSSSHARTNVAHVDVNIHGLCKAVCHGPTRHPPEALTTQLLHQVLRDGAWLEKAEQHVQLLIQESQLDTHTSSRARAGDEHARVGAQGTHHHRLRPSSAAVPQKGVVAVRGHLSSCLDESRVLLAGEYVAGGGERPASAAREDGSQSDYRLLSNRGAHSSRSFAPLAMSRVMGVPLRLAGSYPK